MKRATLLMKCLHRACKWKAGTMRDLIFRMTSSKKFSFLKIHGKQLKIFNVGNLTKWKENFKKENCWYLCVHRKHFPSMPHIFKVHSSIASKRWAMLLRTVSVSSDVCCCMEVLCTIFQVSRHRLWTVDSV